MVLGSEFGKVRLPYTLASRMALPHGGVGEEQGLLPRLPHLDIIEKPAAGYIGLSTLLCKSGLAHRSL
jgi:hypothetical protein